jgi:glycosyltransferase involved in cell wall biosynthesis
VVLPLTGDNHAAGQTSILEALSCGAPVVISRGRTSAIFPGVATVIVCASQDPDEWVETIERAKSLLRSDPESLRSAAELVRALHSPRVVRDKLLSALTAA